ncbi:MAG: hypothetical protein ABIA63_03640, partial [bacterium]
PSTEQVVTASFESSSTAAGTNSDEADFLSDSLTSRAANESSAPEKPRETTTLLELMRLLSVKILKHIEKNKYEVDINRNKTTLNFSRPVQEAMSFFASPRHIFNPAASQDLSLLPRAGEFLPPPQSSDSLKPELTSEQINNLIKRELMLQKLPVHPETVEQINAQIKNDMPMLESRNIQTRDWISFVVKWIGMDIPKTENRTDFLIHQYLRENIFGNLKEAAGEMQRIAEPMRQDMMKNLSGLFEILERLQKMIPEPDSKVMAEEIREFTRNSGLFYENKLLSMVRTGQVPEDIRNDLKYNMSLLMDRFGYSPLTQTTETLNRVMTQYVQHLETAQRVFSEQEYQPMMMSINTPEGRQEAMIYYKKQGKGKKPDPENASISMSVDTSVLHEVFADVAISRGKVNIDFNLSNGKFVKLFMKNFNDLQKNLENLGYKTGKIAANSRIVRTDPALPRISRKASGDSELDIRA